MHFEYWSKKAKLHFHKPLHSHIHGFMKMSQLKDRREATYAEVGSVVAKERFHIVGNNCYDGLRACAAAKEAKKVKETKESFHVFENNYNDDLKVFSHEETTADDAKMASEN